MFECKCFLPFSSYRDQPGNAIKSTFEGDLKDMLNTARRGPKRLFYQIVSFVVFKVFGFLKINQFENLTMLQTTVANVLVNCFFSAFF